MGAAVAGRRRIPAGAEDVRARRAGEREGARPLRGRRRPAGGRARRTCEGLAAGAGAHRRCDCEEDDRRAAQARQPRRRLGLTQL